MMIPVVLAGSRHRSEALEKLGPVLSSWSAQWCVGGDARLEGAEAEAVIPEWQLVADKGRVFLKLVSGKWSDILFGDSAELIPDDDVAQQLIQQACQALLKDVAAALGTRGETSAVDAAHHKVAARAGQVVLAAGLNQSVLHVAVDAALLGSVKAAVTRLPLANRREAMSEALVSLKVELPLARVAIDDFIGLKPGDIICSQTPLSASFLVSVGDNPLPVSASLGACDSHKAVKLHARPSEK